MTAYAYDAQRWYAGEVAADTPGSTPIAPLIGSVSSLPGEPRARWCRYEWRVEPYTPQPVPDVVERWAAHYVLTAEGHMPAVRAAIDAIPDPVQRELARIEFDQRPTIRRLSPLTQQLQQLAGITEQQRDAMFIAAAQLAGE